jgi:hypothetical protein
MTRPRGGQPSVSPRRSAILTAPRIRRAALTILAVASPEAHIARLRRRSWPPRRGAAWEPASELSGSARKNLLEDRTLATVA